MENNRQLFFDYWKYRVNMYNFTYADKKVKYIVVVYSQDIFSIVDIIMTKTKEKAIKFINDHTNYYAIFNRHFYYKLYNVRDIDKDTKTKLK